MLFVGCVVKIRLFFFRLVVRVEGQGGLRMWAVWNKSQTIMSTDGLLVQLACKTSQVLESSSEEIKLSSIVVYTQIHIDIYAISSSFHSADKVGHFPSANTRLSLVLEARKFLSFSL
jgi:hypothetical protein